MLHLFALDGGEHFLSGIESLLTAIYIAFGLVILAPVIIWAVLFRRRCRPRCGACRTLLRPTALFCDQCGSSQLDKPIA
jgi:hypothetical protein